MSLLTALHGARIFDGLEWHDGKCLLLVGDAFVGIVDGGEVPAGAVSVDYDGQWIVPGFIDLQVNGGGGVQFGEASSLEAIATIAAAHAKYGTTKLLPTLITETARVTEAVLEAGAAAYGASVPGYLGLHLEGPHLSLARKGAHDPSLIRPMESEDLQRLLRFRDRVGVMLTTLAPENATLEQVRALADGGIVVSIGHTDTTAKKATQYFSAGAKMVTHLFNAMSPLTHREPGLVGAALDNGSVFGGVIADGYHVDPIAMGIALRAKQGPGKIFLVTDAMAPIGTGVTEMVLNGRRILRANGKLTLADGTLAGADIDMLSCVKFAAANLGITLEESIRMASLYPARAVGVEKTHGRIAAGYRADFVVLDPQLSHISTWIDGRRAV